MSIWDANVTSGGFTCYTPAPGSHEFIKIATAWELLVLLDSISKSHKLKSRPRIMCTLGLVLESAG